MWKRVPSGEQEHECGTVNKQGELWEPALEFWVASGLRRIARPLTKDSWVGVAES